MSGNLPYFVIRGIIYSFLNHGYTLNENDVITTVLTELTSNKLIDSMDKANLDFGVIYSIFDLLSALGFLFFKLDKPQKQLNWRGFAGFYEKNYGLFNKGVKQANGDGGNQLSAIPNIYDMFTRTFFERMFSQPSAIISYADYQQISAQLLYSGKDFTKQIEGTVKEKEARKKAQDTFIKLLNYIGLIKIIQDKNTEMGEASYQWNSSINSILKGESQISEIDYFDQRTKNCIFESASDYLRTIARNLETKAGFALLKGKDWKYLMRKLFIIIGRGPNPTIEAESIHSSILIDSLKWYIDIDFSSTKHVSPQHALIAYNFEKMW